MKRSIAALMACSAMILTACSAGPQTPSAASSTPAATSPLEEYLAGTDTEQSDTERATKERAVQEKVAACMKAQGFQYVPVDGAAPVAAVKERPLGDRSWTEKYGYGISTTETVGPQDLADDPNAAIRNKMTKAQRKAYDTALIGPPTTTGGGTGSGPAVAGPGVVIGGPQGPMTSSGGAGCMGKAREAVYGKQAQFDMSEFKDLFDALGKLQQSVKTDPRVTPLITEWTGCMADHGYPHYTDPEAPQNAIMKRWADLHGWKFDQSEGGGTSMSVDSADEAVTPDPTKLAAVRKDEIAVALVDFDCRKPYQAVVDQVRLDLEKQFVADHKAELERYRDAMNGVN